MAGGIDNDLFQIGHRPAGPDDLLFDVEKLLGDVGSVEIEVRQAKQIGGVGAAIVRRDGLIGDDEAASGILGCKTGIRHLVDQDLERNAFVGLLRKRSSKPGDFAAELCVDGALFIGGQIAEIRNAIITAPRRLLEQSIASLMSRGRGPIDQPR